MRTQNGSVTEYLVPKNKHIKSMQVTRLDIYNIGLYYLLSHSIELFATISISSGIGSHIINTVVHNLFHVCDPLNATDVVWNPTLLQVKT